MLTGEWEKFAAAVKGTVKVAYWDTEQGGGMPPLLGSIQGTPTIRFFVPNRKSANNKKRVLDYNQERKAAALVRYAKTYEPNFVESVKTMDAWSKFVAKAQKFELPIAVLFSNSKTTASMLKAVSVEYRRRMLIAEVKKSSGTEKLLSQFGVTEFPTLAALDSEGKTIKSTMKKKPTVNALSLFCGEHALNKPIGPSSQKAKPKAEL